MNACLKIFGAAWLALGATACSSFPLAPVSEQGRGVRQPAAATRVVQPGDTLYSIAWESGRDFRELARWNGIPPPYVIHPGQRLRLYPPSGAESAPRPSPPARTEVRKAPVPDKPAPRAPAPPGRLSWTWPAQGELLERFTANGPNKGIAIAGRTGQPILAAEAGEVVYRGGGLRGYGQLIIIRHNEDFLSAYAHCDRIYVKEGDVIQRGQRIADIGSTGTDRAKLHFEIRYRGTPVDPLNHLPRK